MASQNLILCGPFLPSIFFSTYQLELCKLIHLLYLAFVPTFYKLNLYSKHIVNFLGHSYYTVIIYLKILFILIYRLIKLSYLLKKKS